jgi:hypothetical protein
MPNNNVVRVIATSNWVSMVGDVPIGLYSKAGLGTGVLISPYFMLTAAHVVAWGRDRNGFQDVYTSSTYDLMPGYDNGTALPTKTETNASAIFFAGLR